MDAARIRFMIAIGALALLVGCATPDTTAGDSPSRDDVLTVQEAISAGSGEVRVRGYVLIAADRVARLCSGLAGSYPPQCGAPALVVRGLAAEAIPNRESAQGVVWGGEMTLRGTLAEGVLEVA
ncbi:hypothetical protein QLQ12_02505 [Actinoplanes sp. NEAU-A12]|uniref:Lipoprotein n=1 Tax=Actinoplanes sandaracinus TaxID=3045177 RepID=A0ABT6WCN3_9ACTN|nr:hypothetical protein [Actinoplanes sandaracinus]MDI6097470.1 hypothetical protein [Actinoplanes sandaracinus]